MPKWADIKNNRDAARDYVVDDACNDTHSVKVADYRLAWITDDRRDYFASFDRHAPKLARVFFTVCEQISQLINRVFLTACLAQSRSSVAVLLLDVPAIYVITDLFR
jgi:hypothetical protein